MPSHETLREFARELAPIAHKCNTERYREINEHELCVIKRFLDLHFIDVTHVSAERVVIYRGGREIVNLTEVFLKIINEIGKEHEAAELFIHHLLKMDTSGRRIKKFFGLHIPDAEETLLNRIFQHQSSGTLDGPTVLRLDELGNELVIDAQDDDQCFDGTHRYCGGKITRHRSTKLLDALVCKKCYLRINIPSHVFTHADFKQ